MISFPQLLMNRELGVPGAQSKIREAIDRVTANNLIRDDFNSETIELSQSSFHRVFRNGDFVAVLSVNKTGRKVQKLALWSLSTRCKLWDLEIQDYKESNPGHCMLSKSGMVLVDSFSSPRDKIIMVDGKQSGMLSTHAFRSIIPIGMRILGSWAERRNPDDREPRWLPENSNLFFGEWDKEGRLLNSHQLDHTRGRWTHISTCNENFWVRLSGSNQADLPSIIEVIDRLIGTIETFRLPLHPDEEQFSSACIVQNQLFYGRNVIRPWGEYNIPVKYEPTICIYDVVKKRIIGEFPTEAEQGEPKHLVANQHYVAWLEYRGSSDDRVKYLTILNNKIKEATTVRYCVDDSKVVLDISGAVLSVTYAEGNWNTGWAGWRRKVIDMTNGELKCDVKYKRFPWGECSISNGNMLITDCFSSKPRMYVESFLSQGSSNEDLSFRRNPAE